MSRLAKKVIRWFNENKELDRFQYRFTGQDSRLFLQNFMFIIDSIKQPHDSAKQTFFLHIFAYMSFQLRQIVSMFCRVVNISQENIAELLGNPVQTFLDVTVYLALYPQQSGLWGISFLHMHVMCFRNTTWG